MKSAIPLLLAAIWLSAPAGAQEDRRERSTERREVQRQRRTTPPQRSVQPQRQRQSPSNVRDTARFRRDDGRLGTIRNARPRESTQQARPRLDLNRMGTLRNNPAERRLNTLRRFDTTRRTAPTQRGLDTTRRSDNQRRSSDLTPRSRSFDGRRQDWDRRVYNGRWQARTPVRYGPERRYTRPFTHRWGDRVHQLPARARVYDYGGARYWIDRGVVYAHGPSGYYVTRPPIGLTLSWLPRGYTVYNFGGVPYYYYDNVWYRPAAGLSLSFNFDDDDDYEDYLDDLEDYYEDLEDYYEDLDDDERRFEVVQVPVGGMLHELPGPYETVIIDGQTFFRWGDLYFVQVMEGNRVMYLRVDPWQR